MHPFESRGLGLAPFQYLSSYEDRGPHNVVINGVECQVGSPGQPMGSCDYCGQGIAICCQVQSADGKKFIVGQDCISKVYSDKNVASTATERSPEFKAFKKDMADRARKARHAREAIKKEQLMAWSIENADALKAKPHPNKYWADKGETLLDSVQWAIRCAGVKYASEAVNHAKKVLV